MLLWTLYCCILAVPFLYSVKADYLLKTFVSLQVSINQKRLFQINPSRFSMYARSVGTYSWKIFLKALFSGWACLNPPTRNLFLLSIFHAKRTIQSRKKITTCLLILYDANSILKKHNSTQLNPNLDPGHTVILEYFNIKE